MTSPNRESGWTNYAHTWEGWISRCLALEETEALGEQIPQSWVDLVADPCAATIQKVWAVAGDSLPRFVDYLTHSILEARVADSQIGYLLVYFLKDWRDLGPDGYEDGFMMSGLPTAEEDIARFESGVGILPSSMRTLWLTHGFIQRRDGTFNGELTLRDSSDSPVAVRVVSLSLTKQENQLIECRLTLSINPEL